MNRSLKLAVFLPVAATLGCGGEPRGPLLAGGQEVKERIAELKDPSPKVRRQAVMKLGNVGDADPAAAEGIAEALRDADAQVRHDAIVAAFKLKKPGPDILAKLEAMSQSDGDARVKEAASQAVANMNKR